MTILHANEDDPQINNRYTINRDTQFPAHEGWFPYQNLHHILTRNNLYALKHDHFFPLPTQQYHNNLELAALKLATQIFTKCNPNYIATTITPTITPHTPHQQTTTNDAEKNHSRHHKKTPQTPSSNTYRTQSRTTQPPPP
jgi:hypothetical protein